jgi:hypothetical protein
VYGQDDNHYYLCRNDKINVKYPRQPVTACAGFEKRDNPSDAPSRCMS